MREPAVPETYPDIVYELPRRMRLVFEALFRANGKFVNYDRLADMVYADDIDGGPLGARENCYTHVCKLRKRLAGIWMTIATSRFDGCRLVHTGAPKEDTIKGPRGVLPRRVLRRREARRAQRKTGTA